MHKDFSLVEVSLKTAVDVFVCTVSLTAEVPPCVIGKGHAQAQRHAGTLMARIVSDAHLIFRSNLQTYPLPVSDCQMRFMPHMSHICSLSSLKGSVNHVNMSRGECTVTSVGFLPHLEVPAIQVILPVLLLFPRSPAVREELVSAPIKGKMPILHSVSEQPQSINQPGGTETEMMCMSMCSRTSSRLGLFSHF